MINNRIISALGMSLDGSMAKQKGIAHNMSNINTPGFKALQVSFQDELQDALGSNSRKLTLKTTKEKHISNKSGQFTPQVIKDESPGLRADGNNVDMDKEMVDMAKNNIYYDTVVGQLNKRLEIMKFASSDGRR